MKYNGIKVKAKEKRQEEEQEYYLEYSRGG